MFVGLSKNIFVHFLFTQLYLIYLKSWNIRCNMNKSSLLMVELSFIIVGYPWVIASSTYHVKDAITRGYPTMTIYMMRVKFGPHYLQFLKVFSYHWHYITSNANKNPSKIDIFLTFLFWMGNIDIHVRFGQEQTFATYKSWIDTSLM